jgi:radical SAM superfamily enzyme YgiQ (UPF0313 family)
MRIYLADLVYDTIKTNHVVPLNISYLAAHLSEKLPGKLDIKLFKYPKELEKAIKETPPDLLGLSNYSWNRRLNRAFLDMTKRVSPKTVTVMGGPDIRIDPQGIHDFLKKYAFLDYYIMFEGESPFAELVENLLTGNAEIPDGCATIVDDNLMYQSRDQMQNKDKVFASPYLSGWLDPFLKDPHMEPLFETNRGCPYQCVYCAWGISTLSKIRFRSQDMIYKEIEYVAEHSCGQLSWKFADANMGIHPRDIEIIKKVKSVMSINGLQNNVVISSAKNNTQQNVEIADILGDSQLAGVAIQSSDQEVLQLSGRGKIKFDHLTKQIEAYRVRNLPVYTDMLIGLPGEDANSHFESLSAAFDLGFESMQITDIRLLPGTEYENDEFREKYQIQTKFRPIFGAYGIYDEKPVFELEENIRKTIDMSIEEMTSFKVLHWLIYLTWNLGLFKPLLKYGLRQGINPAMILNDVANTSNPVLTKMFDNLKQEAKDEWFDTESEMIQFYEQMDNFDRLKTNFTKLTLKYLVLVYQDPQATHALELEMVNSLRNALDDRGIRDTGMLAKVSEISQLLICMDPLQKEFKKYANFPSKVVNLVLTNPMSEEEEFVELEISRSKERVDHCHSSLMRSGKKDLSLKNLTRFFEFGAGGFTNLKNQVKVITPAKASATIC